jgi:GNAT superfamily N-acetyltransferase
VFHDEISAAAARERQKSWLAAAERSRQAQYARQLTAGRRFSLRDGSEVAIRRVRGADAPLLADGFSRLSRQSRWMRFLMAKPALSEAEVRYLTEVDHHDHEALVALDQATGRGVGVVRYVRDTADPQAAEIAVTVIDAWQRRGLGAVLLAELSDRARMAGIRRLTALVAAENEGGIRLLRCAGAEFVRREEDTVQYEIPLGPASPRRWPRPLRPAAQLRF